MVKEAEENAEDDKKRRELVEAKNQAESLIHSTEKTLEEHGDKVDPTTIEAIELAIAALKDVLEKDDDAEEIKSGIQNVTEAAMKLGEAIYKAEQEAEAGEAEPTMVRPRVWTTISSMPISRISTTTSGSKVRDAVAGP